MEKLGGVNAGARLARLSQDPNRQQRPGALDDREGPSRRHARRAQQGRQGQATGTRPARRTGRQEAVQASGTQNVRQERGGTERLAAQNTRRPGAGQGQVIDTLA